MTSTPEAEENVLCKSWMQVLRQEGHWKCLLFTCLIHLCLSAILWCRLSMESKPLVTRKFRCDESYVYIPLSFMVMLYLVYLVECWHSTTRIQLSRAIDVTKVYQHVSNMKEASPVVWWKIVCYHYVRRTQRETQCRNSHVYVSNKTYYEKVNSHTSSKFFSYSRFGVKDISRNLKNLEDFPIAQIRFSKRFLFANAASAREFQDQRTEFFREYEQFDDYVEFQEGLDLRNVKFVHQLISRGRSSWYTNLAVFWLASFFFLSWPLRILIEHGTVVILFRISKQFGGINHESDSSQEMLMGRHPATAMSEYEECTNDENDSVLPSYSEVMLLYPRTKEMRESICSCDECNDILPSYSMCIPPSSSFHSVTKVHRGIPFLRSYCHEYYFSNMETTLKRSVTEKAIFQIKDHKRNQMEKLSHAYSSDPISFAYKYKITSMTNFNEEFS